MATSSGSDDADAKEEGKQRHVGEEEQYEMVTVASASRGQVDAFKQAASRSALSIEAEEEAASPVRWSTGAHSQEVDASSSGDNAVGGFSAWELLTSMFGGLLPPRALGEAYARVRGQGRGGDEEGDLAAMVEVCVSLSIVGVARQASDMTCMRQVRCVALSLFPHRRQCTPNTKHAGGGPHAGPRARRGRGREGGGRRWT